MPSIEWQHNGTYYRCDSSDPVVIARFMLERARMVRDQSDLVRIQIFPMQVGPTYKDVDWPQGTHTLDVGTLDALNRLSRYILAWQAEQTQPLVEVKDDTRTTDRSADRNTPIGGDGA